ncbi:MAG: MBL fold metallo-hydrolase [Brevundimonas sp.]|jgi:metallo-beta-lactamase family protein|uniref:MBL fold metallo-hydrolase n=1 Tax=Brevundimonas sp. TaxID=1871086 RepID=UPI0018071515|nr:MBL fold metallo-hydrolase [Brevundimonas sp.]MBA4803067.1 MBL fold metallo-hydrolase [Brevundimonas sp.]
MTVRLTFHGAAECVTGSCLLLETGGRRVLVDCGMFQGPKTLKALNYDAFPFDPGSIDAVLLTHAHIDHSGLLPKLVRAGFSGAIHATAATRDLCEVMLADAAGIQESEVRRLNRRNAQRGLPPVEPIYTTADVEPTLRRFQRVKPGERTAICDGVAAMWWPAGHMLGASSIEVRAGEGDGGVSLLFSGDVGSRRQPFLPRPDGPVGVDHVILESTYGDRERIELELDARRRALAAELREARAAGGPLLIPTFAVGRAQELVLDLLAVMEAEPDLATEIFLDSPLAIEATEVFLRRGWNPESGENPFEPLRRAKRLHHLTHPQDSDGLHRLSGWHVILAGSGMCDAGRIRKHLKRLLWRRETTVLMTGYQAAGTLGRFLLEGRSAVRIQGEEVRVAARIRSLDCYSGHADATELVEWLGERGTVSGAVLLNHGEPEAVAALAGRLGAGGWRAVPAELDRTYVLGPDSFEVLRGGGARLSPGQPTRPDWHNDRAALLVALNEVLQGMPDDARRADLLRRLALTVEAER